MKNKIPVEVQCANLTSEQKKEIIKSGTIYLVSLWIAAIAAVVLVILSFTSDGATTKLVCFGVILALLVVMVIYNVIFYKKFPGFNETLYLYLLSQRKKNK